MQRVWLCINSGRQPEDSCYHESSDFLDQSHSLHLFDLSLNRRENSNQVQAMQLFYSLDQVIWLKIWKCTLLKTIRQHTFMIDETEQQGKHSARKPPKLIIPLICQTSSHALKCVREKLTSWEAQKLATWQAVKMTKGQNDKTERWVYDKMTGWQDDRMTRQQHDKSCQMLPKRCQTWWSLQ